jgi:transposase-like protein
MNPMRLKLILPVVNPVRYTQPGQCERAGCGGKYLRQRQIVRKTLRDGEYNEVKAYRYECLRCGHTFRVYPQGVSHAQVSQRVKGMAVMLYLLGLSYGAVEIVLGALGVYLSKTSAYRAVQAAGERVTGMKRNQIMQGYTTKAIGADLTSVKCKGKWLPIGVIVDPLNGLVLSIDQLSGEDAQTLQDWVEPIAETVGAQVLVTDDADAFKHVADESGLDQQVCKSHVVRNTEELILSLTQALEMQPADASLAEVQIEPTQALDDLHRLGELIHSRQPDEDHELLALYNRYAGAIPPQKGKSASIAYRMRNLFLDRWNLWPRLTFYRTWKGEDGQPILDGTNNADERAIGWWVKERYRSMRGYKREQSALNVSRLIAFCGNHLSGGLDLISLIA